MSKHGLRALLRRATGEAVARSVKATEKARSSQPPRPGDVYVLRASADWPVEWIVLEPDPRDPRRVISIPADTQPLAGRADLTASDDAGGPLTLRCGLALSLPPTVFDPALRSRRLSPADLNDAIEIRRRLADGTLEGSIFDEEVELDPAYRDWMRDVPGAARAAVEASAGAKAKVLPFPAGRPERRARHWPETLAAALAIVAVGLSVLVVGQRRQIERLTKPLFEPPVEEIRLNDPQRTPARWQLPSGTRQLIVYLVLREPYPCTRFRLELLNAEGRLLWVHDDFEFAEDEIKLVLPRSFLEREPARMRLLGRCDGEMKRLDELRLAIAWE